MGRVLAAVHLEAVRELAVAGLADRDIAVRLGLGRSTVTRARGRLGLSARWPRGTPCPAEIRDRMSEGCYRRYGKGPITVEEVRQLAALGWSDRRIGKLLGGRSFSVIHRFRRKNGIPAGNLRRLTDEATVRRLVGEGLTNVEIADRLGVPTEHVQRLMRQRGIKAAYRSGYANGLPRVKEKTVATKRWRLDQKLDAYGLPPGLTEFQLKILIALMSGPLTKRRLVEMLGPQHRQTGDKLSKRLSQLSREGLVTAELRFLKTCPGRGRHRLPNLYHLTLKTLNRMALVHDNADQRPNRVEPNGGRRGVRAPGVADAAAGAGGGGAAERTAVA